MKVWSQYHLGNCWYWLFRKSHHFYFRFQSQFGKVALMGQEAFCLAFISFRTVWKLHAWYQPMWRLTGYISLFFFLLFGFVCGHERCYFLFICLEIARSCRWRVCISEVLRWHWTCYEICRPRNRSASGTAGGLTLLAAISTLVHCTVQSHTDEHFFIGEEYLIIIVCLYCDQAHLSSDLTRIFAGSRTPPAYCYCFILTTQSQTWC